MPVPRNLIDQLTALNAMGGLTPNVLHNILVAHGITNDQNPAPTQFVNQSPMPRGAPPPGSFDFVTPLPIQSLLQQLPSPVANALLSLNPALGFTANVPNPWTMPSWGVIGGLRKRW